MSRDIKYRLWHIADKKYYIVYCLQFSDEFDEPLNYEAAQIRRNDEWEWIEKDTYILEQFTGRKDKNGNPIYEGDVVKKDGKIYVIRYSQHCFDLACSTNDWPKRQDGYSYYSTSWDDIEIIGNIHESKELIDGND